MSAGIINGCGLVTSAGATFDETVAAYVADNRGFARDRNVIGVDGLPVTLGAVVPMHDEPDVLRRLMKLIDQALSDLEAQLGEAPLPKAVLVLLPAWVREADPDAQLTTDLTARVDRSSDQIGLNWADQVS